MLINILLNPQRLPVIKVLPIAFISRSTKIKEQSSSCLAGSFLLKILEHHYRGSCVRIPLANKVI